MSADVSQYRASVRTPVGIAAVTLAQRTAFLLSLGLILSIPIEGAVMFASVGRLSRVIGLAAAAAWFATVLCRGSIRRPASFHYCVGLFVLWNVASVVWTIALPETLDRSKTYLQLAVMTLLIWDLYLSRAHLRWGLQAFVCGASIAALATMRNFLTNKTVFHARFTATGLHVDDLGLVLALALPIAWYLAWHDPHHSRFRWGQRAFNLCYLPLALFAIGLTGTRGAAVAALPAAMYALGSLAILPPRQRNKAAIVLVLGVGAAIPFIPASSIARLSTIGAEVASGDLNGRVELWRKGLNAFAQTPWLGVGSSGFPAIENNDAQHVAHNSFVSILVELGLIGAVLIGLVVVVLAISIVRLPTRERHFWTSVLAVLVLGASTLTWEHRKPAWLLMTLAVCASARPDRGETLRRSPIGEVAG